VTLFVACAVVHGLGPARSTQSQWLRRTPSVGPTYELVARLLLFRAMIGPLLMTAVLTSGTTTASGTSLWWGDDNAGGHIHGHETVVGQRHRACHWGSRRTWRGDSKPGCPPPNGRILPYTGLEMTLSQWAFTVLTEIEE